MMVVPSVLAAQQAMPGKLRQSGALALFHDVSP
jgi:hypothetical protein